jgi:alpha-ribazole phosphatase
MAMIEVHLVRHGAVDAAGQVYGARVDPPLSAAGRAEVDELRLRVVEELGTMRLLCSPATRAAQTLEALRAGPASIDHRWAERDLGRHEGRSWDEFWAAAPSEVTTDPAAYVRWIPPGGEAVASMRRRVVDALEALATDPDAAPSTLVVTHSGPIVCAIAHALDLQDATATRLQVATATVTTLRRYDGGHWTVRAVGR